MGKTAAIPVNHLIVRYVTEELHDAVQPELLARWRTRSA